jgi:hypothetical protein
MLHLDNPDKFQYSRELIVCHGGADVTELLKPTAANRYVLLDEILDYINDNEITQFIDLDRYARKNRYDDWFPGQHIKALHDAGEA